jgi:glyoxylase-like metal-dependent hydrolase (beta-lactamase superfamily II)
MPSSDPVRDLVDSRPFGPEVLRAANAPEAVLVAPEIYMSPGTSNAYMITGSGERLIINTGLGFEALVHKRNFDAISTAPTRYILVTQGHVDHVGGVGLFREAQTLFVAQSHNARCQADFGIERMALHAAALSFPHPRSGEIVRVEAPLQEDLAAPFRRMQIPPELLPAPR